MGSERFRFDYGPKRESAVSYPSRNAADYVIETTMNLTLETEQEADGRWIAEVPELAGVLAYGATREAAMAKAEALALRVIAERLDHGEARPIGISITVAAE